MAVKDDGMNRKPTRNSGDTRMSWERKQILWQRDTDLYIYDGGKSNKKQVKLIKQWKKGGNVSSNVISEPVTPSRSPVTPDPSPTCFPFPLIGSSPMLARSLSPVVRFSFCTTLSFPACITWLLILPVWSFAWTPWTLILCLIPVILSLMVHFNPCLITGINLFQTDIFSQQQQI